MIAGGPGPVPIVPRGCYTLTRTATPIVVVLVLLLVLGASVAWTIASFSAWSAGAP